MKKDKLIKKITNDLFEKQDLEYQKNSIGFFKEEINPIGVKIPNVRKIAKKRFKELEKLDKKEVFVICEKLFSEKFDEHKTIAFIWLSYLAESGKFTKSDFDILERWLEKYISNWAHCDEFCTHSLGAILLEFPELVPRVKKWSKSKNRWLRRSSAVSMIVPVRKEKKFLKEIFFVTKQMIDDDDDLVQKGYGWALKEGSNLYTKEVFDFVMKNKKVMPRTALRYAIEKMPDAMKSLAMER